MVRFLHWAASHGWVYDLIQTAAGANKVYSEVARRITSDRPNPVVLDVGAGTGTLRRHLKLNCRYICLDLETPKLQQFRRKFAGGMALMADASQLPMPDRSVDIAVCTMVAHHLPEEIFEAFLGECQRVLRPDGCFVFLDWLRPTTRVPSRILCALDRGAHPYRLEQLQRLAGEHFEIASSHRFAIFHEYMVMVLRPVSSRVGTVTSSYQTADK